MIACPLIDFFVASIGQFLHHLHGPTRIIEGNRSVVRYRHLNIHFDESHFVRRIHHLSPRDFC